MTGSKASRTNIYLVESRLESVLIGTYDSANAERIYRNIVRLRNSKAFYALTSKRSKARFISEMNESTAVVRVTNLTDTE